MKFKVSIFECWESEHVVEADDEEQAIEYADNGDDGLVKYTFIGSRKEYGHLIGDISAQIMREPEEKKESL